MDAIFVVEALYVLEDFDGRFLADGKRAGADAFRLDDPHEGLRRGVVP